jgi:hypothetical protein
MAHLGFVFYSIQIFRELQFVGLNGTHYFGEFTLDLSTMELDSPS